MVEEREERSKEVMFVVEVMKCGIFCAGWRSW